MEQQQTFGARVKWAREAMKLSKVALAKRVRCAETEIRQIESGRTLSPNVHLALRLAEVLNEDPFTLVLGIDSPIIPW